MQHNRATFIGDDAKLFILQPRHTTIQYKGYSVKRVSRRMWVIGDNTKKPLKLNKLLERFV